MHIQTPFNLETAEDVIAPQIKKIAPHKTALEFDARLPSLRLSNMTNSLLPANALVASDLAAV
jgi:hypothetical protein